jgi:uncharacterized protein (TIGR03435 family)
MNAIVFHCLASAAMAQSFAVASIKPSPADELDAIKRSGRSPLFPEQGISISGDRVTVAGLTVATLIRAAFNLRASQLSRGPDWIGNDAYDIVASAEGGTLTFEQARTMLQTLLADRFQLKFHKEMKEGVVYALVAGRNRSKLRESAAGKYSTRANVGSSQIQLTMSGATTAQLCGRLSTFVARPVIDKTGLGGMFDLSLEFAPENAESSEFPSIFTAVQEQLGLRLESARGPVEIFVIDRVERLSGN